MSKCKIKLVYLIFEREERQGEKKRKGEGREDETGRVLKERRKETGKDKQKRKKEEN